MTQDDLSNLQLHYICPECFKVTHVGSRGEDVHIPFGDHYATHYCPPKTVAHQWAFAHAVPSAWDALCYLGCVCV